MSKKLEPVSREFLGIVVEYPHRSAYPEYEGKPYFAIKYLENGKDEIVGFGTYKPKVLSQYLQEYFMPQWIPFTMREMTEEEKEEYPDWDYIIDSPLPDNGEEVLVSNGKYVWVDTFCNDGDGCYFDGGEDIEGLAWMKMPKSWKKEE